MTTPRVLALTWVFARVVFAQLTPDQKQADFLYLAGLYAKQYAPYEWKRDTQGFDLLNVKPWLARIQATKDDLDFYEVMVEYVASLNDAHDVYSLPSNFVARLNFTTDIYDGKVLVDSINRTRLPATEFPFLIGYELVSIDGVSAEDLVKSFTKYEIAANPRSTRRLAASLITMRPQSRMPHAVDVGDVAKVMMRRLDGQLESYTIPWTKTGLPLRTVGPVPTPTSAQGADAQPQDYLAPLWRLQNCQIDPKEVLGFGARSPIFAPPPGFQQRLGRVAADVFYSGTFTAGGYRIGFIRIPSFSPSSQLAALQQFQMEITFFQNNTDGLIVDDIRNPGGSVNYMNSVLQLVIPYRFRTLGFELRATSEWVAGISSVLESAKASGEADWIIALLEELKKEVVAANAENRGRTGPVALDDISMERDPIKDMRGNVLAYTKPLMVLVDELSASGGDAFPATIQDNDRGVLFGWRTMGAGGSVVDWEAGSYSEGFTRITQTLMNRKNPVVTEDNPAAPYVENIGVRPEIMVDYMTKENLLLDGRPFVDSFVAAMVDHIRKSR